MSWWAALAPGLLVGALFGGLLFLLRRFYDPVPWRIAAIFGLVVFWMLGSVLFLGRVLLPLNLLWNSSPWKDLERVEPTALHLQWDLVEDQAAFRAEHRRLLARGEWPLWNPRVGAGEPFLANVSAQNGHPLVLLSDLLRIESAPGMIAACKVLLCLVFTFVLLRRWGIGQPGALGGALAYGLSGFVWVQLGWVHTHSAAALPFLLYGVERAVAVGGWRDRLLLGVASGWTLLGGHPETIFYVMSAGVVVGIERWWSTSTGLPLLERAARAAPPIAAVALGAALVAPILAPFVLRLEYSRRATMNETRIESIRRGAQDDGRDLAERLERWVERTVPVAAPVAFGSERFGRSWGFASIFQEGTAFAGSATLLIAMLGLFAVRRRPSWFAGERSALLLAAVGFLFFTQPPGLVRLMVEIPVLRMSGSENRRLSIFLVFALAVLAAGAWERMFRDRRAGDVAADLTSLGGGHGEGLRRPRAALVVIALIAFVLWGYLAHGNPDNPAEHERTRIAHLALQVSVLAGLGAALVLAGHRRGLGWRRRSVWLFALLVAVELSLFHRSLSPGMPASHYFPERPSIEFLRENLGDHRMVGIDGAFKPAYPLVLGIADLRSASPLQPYSLVRATRPLRRSAFSNAIVVADHPLLDLLSVKYVVTAPGDELGPPLREVFRGNLTIWQRPAPMNLAFLPNRARRPAQGGWRQLHEVRSFRDLVLVDRIPSGPSSAELPEAEAEEPAASFWRATSPRSNRVIELAPEPAHIRARVELGERALLATSVFQDGGWRALVDGRRVESVVTNGLFVGVWLPPGEHRVDLVYRPRGFVLGCALSSLALIAGVAWAGRQTLTARRPSA
ncbi:MAG TPA: YfhO family protein [Thermoanaerobaculia bacterium]|nr:YfhO family protein [Thermoanaerobaculia bacterium]